MKFQCDRCKTRYSIADEKARGKILKIRCKNCAGVITVREGMSAPLIIQPASTPPVDGAGKATVPRPREQTIELAVVAPPAPGGTDEPALPGPSGAASGSGSGCDEQWFLSVDGAQDGPMTPAEARLRVARKAASDAMYAWREDFSEWLRVENVPDLAAFLPAPEAPPPPPAPASSADGFDFNIGEPSSVVRLPIPPPPRERQNGMGSLPLPIIADPVAFTSGQAPPRDGVTSGSLGASVIRARRRSARILTVAGAGAAAVVLLIIVAVVVRGRRAAPRHVAPVERGSELVDRFYQGRGLPGAPSGAAAAPATPVATQPEPVADKPAVPVRREPRPTVARPPTPAPGPPVRPMSPAEKEDTFGDALPTGPLTPDDVRNTYRANEIILKRCYERALKQDPMMRVIRLDVQITIGPSGNVDKISMAQQNTALGACVTSAIRNWRFRRSTSDFTTEFPIIFAKRG